MSGPHGDERSFFPFGNPFPMSPPLLLWLDSFEEILTDKLYNLRPENKDDFLSLSWMTLAIKSLCEIHTGINFLFTELQFPASEWDQNWKDFCLYNTMSLIEVCGKFNSELSWLRKSQLLLQFVRHVLDVSSSFPSSGQLIQSHTSLDKWMQQSCSRNIELEKCFSNLHGLAGSNYYFLARDSAKGKVFMRAMYGVKVVTIFVLSVCAAALSGSSKTLMSLQVSDKLLWGKAFNEVQFDANAVIIKRLLSHGNTTMLKELVALDSSVKKLYPLTENESNATETETLMISVLDLGNKMDRFSEELDLLSTQMSAFCKITLMGFAQPNLTMFSKARLKITETLTNIFRYTLVVRDPDIDISDIGSFESGVVSFLDFSALMAENLSLTNLEIWRSIGE